MSGDPASSEVHSLSLPRQFYHSAHILHSFVPFWLHPQRSCTVVSTFSGLRYPFDLHIHILAIGERFLLYSIRWFIISYLLFPRVIQISNIIIFKWRRFNFGKWEHSRRWAYLLFCNWNSIWLQCRNDVFCTLAGVGRKRLPTHAMCIFIR